jgi:Arc/MetJ family transcription regulator
VPSHGRRSICKYGAAILHRHQAISAYNRAVRKHTTIDLDQDLVREAATVLGTTRTTDTVHAALSDVVRRRRREGLFEIPTDLDLQALDVIRSHRFAERAATYEDRTDPPSVDDEAAPEA